MEINAVIPEDLCATFKNTQDLCTSLQLIEVGMHNK